MLNWHPKTGLVRINPNRGFAGDRSASDADPALDAWIEPEMNRAHREWLQREIPDPVQMKDIYVHCAMMEYLRAVAIENGELEREFAIRKGAKKRLVKQGFHLAQEHDQEPLPDVEWLTERELRERLYAIQRATEHAFYLARDQRTLDDTTLDEMHADLMGRKLGRLKRWQPPRVSTYLDTKTEPKYTQRMHSGRTALRGMRGYCDRVRAWVDDPKLPTAVAAAKAHSELYHWHPYPDGNTRMARLMALYVYVSRGEVPPLVTRESASRADDVRIAGYHRKGRPGSQAPLATFLDDAWRTGSPTLVQLYREAQQRPLAQGLEDTIAMMERGARKQTREWFLRGTTAQRAADADAESSKRAREAPEIEEDKRQKKER